MNRISINIEGKTFSMHSKETKRAKFLLAFLLDHLDLIEAKEVETTNTANEMRTLTEVFESVVNAYNNKEVLNFIDVRDLDTMLMDSHPDLVQSIIDSYNNKEVLNFIYVRDLDMIAKEENTNEMKEEKVSRDFSTLYVPNVIDNLDEAQEWIVDNADQIEGIVQSEIDENGTLHVWSDDVNEVGCYDEWEVRELQTEHPKGYGTKYTLRLELVN